MHQADVLRSRIRSVSRLRDVVSAMRSIAATQSQQASVATVAARQYADVIRGAIERARIGRLGRHESAPPSQHNIVVFTSEHGFVGGFNEIVLRAAEQRLATEHAALIMVGRRGAMLARERRMGAAATVAMPSTLHAVIDVAPRIVDVLAEHAVDGSIPSVSTLVGRYDAGVLRPEYTAVFPLDRDPKTPANVDADSRPDCLTYLTTEALSASLAAEWLLAHLMRCAIESFASESSARLHAMELARHRVDQRVADLELDANRLRQDDITTELLDLATGARATSEEP